MPCILTCQQIYAWYTEAYIFDVPVIPMKFPYGICDFYALIDEGYYYADRSARIALIEEAGKHLLFLRPRRFGKSLLLAMLENYYDLAKADDFAKLFGHLSIGAQPTPRHNQYFVMKWDFSMVKSYGTVQEIEKALHQHLNAAIHYFKLYYRNHLQEDIELQPDNGIASFHNAVAAVRTTPHKLYLLIDEYDNFANEVMAASTSSGQAAKRDDYQALVYGEGIVKTVFKAVKALSAGQGVDRVFITGVSPVVMSDISSGYNVARNISLRPEYTDLCGFHETEIAAVLEQVAQDCGLGAEKITEALDMMRTFYNGYRFGYEPGELIYNPTLALYFLDNFSRDCTYPHDILDSNLAMDRNRIKYIGTLPHGQDIIAKALNPQDPPIIGQLANRFGVEDMLSAAKDQPFMGSLLYYLGVLTVGERNAFGELTLQIPNLVIRRLYVERIQETLLPEYEDKEGVREAARRFYHSGDLQALCEFIESRYFQVFDNRDYRWSNELVIKTAFLVTLFSDTFYIMDSETAIARGYADLSLIIRPDMRQYQLLDHLLEFKYIALSDLGLSGAEVKQKTREELAALPLVQTKLNEAQAQLAAHRVTLEQAYAGKLRLCTHAVVALGFERLVWVTATH